MQKIRFIDFRNPSKREFGKGIDFHTFFKYMFENYGYFMKGVFGEMGVDVSCWPDGNLELIEQCEDPIAILIIPDILGDGKEISEKDFPKDIPVIIFSHPLVPKSAIPNAENVYPINLRDFFERLRDMLNGMRAPQDENERNKIRDFCDWVLGICDAIDELFKF